MIIDDHDPIDGTRPSDLGDPAELAVVRVDLHASTLLVVTGEIDASNVHVLAESLQGHECERRLLVDLAGVGFLDAATVGVLAHAAAEAGRRDSTLRVIAVRPFARRLLELLGVAQLLGLGVDPAAPDALAAAAPGRADMDEGDEGP